MALEIKILDYGDIELESSFLVLGRDCGRTRRVLTLGFLDARRHLADSGRHRLPLEPDHGDAGHARPAVPREHDREPAQKHGVRIGDVRYVLHTHLHIDHAGKDDLFPMNIDRGRQSARA